MNNSQILRSRSSDDWSARESLKRGALDRSTHQRLTLARICSAIDRVFRRCAWCCRSEIRRIKVIAEKSTVSIYMSDWISRILHRNPRRNRQSFACTRLSLDASGNSPFSCVTACRLN
jgi:hypothetical protein